MTGFPTLENFATPEAWNTAWEEMYPRLSSPNIPKSCFQSQVEQLNKQPLLISLQRMTNPVDHDELCDLQQEITRACISHFQRRDLEAKWMAASPALRQKHILIALAKGCSFRPNLNDPRCYCAHELRLEYLGGRDGRVLLEMVKSVLLDDHSVMPKTPRYISHPFWDKFVADQNKRKLTDVEKLVFDGLLILRTKLICHVLHFTMYSFLGLVVPGIDAIFAESDKATIAAGWGKAKTMMKPMLAQAFGREGAKTFLKERKTALPPMFSTRKRNGHHCAYPACQQVEPSDGSVRFAHCKACAEKVQREFRYCSVECQRKDWKPRHKVMCGKPLDTETISQVITTFLTPTEAPVHAAEYIGAPIGGFQRSEYLSGHVAWLNNHPETDYRLTDKYGSGRDMIIGSVGQPMTKHLFRIYRELAMTQGTMVVVGILAHFLCWFVLYSKDDDSSEGLTPASIVAQLAREYELEVELLRKRVLAVQRDNRDDPQNKPLLLKGMHEVVWMTEYGVVDPKETRITFI
ncbi:hypothetical protein C8R43DRAFT_700353 [Mycena crocata]|nr:hypothetical protein C8R43DRAFT_700353 [Mycena crocata]